MRIEVDYSGRDTTHSVLNWIAVSIALHIAPCALSSCGGEVVVELSFNILHCCWLEDRGNEGSCKRTSTNYKGGGNTLAL